MPILLAALRARIADRPAGRTRVAAATLDELAARLKSARFGVAVWSAASLDALTIEMLCGLVSDLNATTRFSGLPLAPVDNAMGVLQTCGWTSGFPPRTGFGRGFAEHDPWLFDSRRLVESGETDCVVWISAYRAQAPGWRETPPTIALTGQGAGFRPAPRVQIQVGRPGVDHACVQHSASTGTLVAVEASAPSGIVSVADAIARIAAALPGHGRAPMLTRLAGGRVIDPANRRDAVGDIWMRDGRIVAAPHGRARRRDLRCRRQDRDGRRHRYPLAHRRLEREQCAAAAARISGRGAGRSRHAMGWHRLDGPGDRQPLCRHGIYHGRRAGGLAAACLASPSRADRHPDHRQGDARHPGQ